MNIVGTKKSWNNKTNKDCFDLSGPTDVDHIWPVSLNGSNISMNRQKITEKANKDKADNTSGIVGKYQFAVHKKTTKKDKQGNQHIYGVMYIRKSSSSKDAWTEVIPV